MSKYIIEIEEGKEGVMFCQSGIVSIGLHLKDEESLRGLGIKSAMPYTEPDTEKIRKQGYDKGLDDLGNALRLLLFQYSNYTLQEIFGYDTARAVVEHFEGSEIVARIRCYEGGVKQDVETIRKEAYKDGYKTAKVQCNIQAEKDLREVGERHYQKGYQDATVKISSDEQAIAEKAYQSGLNDAWEAARKIYLPIEYGGIPADVLRQIFNNKSASGIFKKVSASEAVEKIRQYEQEQQESITVEDVMRQYLDTFCKGQRNCEGCPLRTPDFTCGRGYHFLHDYISNEEVRRAYAAVLAKMKE